MHGSWRRKRKQTFIETPSQDRTVIFLGLAYSLPVLNPAFAVSHHLFEEQTMSV